MAKIKWETKEEKAQSGTIGGWKINRNNSGVLRGYGAYERLKKKFEGGIK